METTWARGDLWWNYRFLGIFFFLSENKHTTNRLPHRQAELDFPSTTYPPQLRWVTHPCASCLRVGALGNVEILSEKLAIGVCKRAPVWMEKSRSDIAPQRWQTGGVSWSGVSWLKRRSPIQTQVTQTFRRTYNCVFLFHKGRWRCCTSILKISFAPALFIWMQFISRCCGQVTCVLTLLTSSWPAYKEEHWCGNPIAEALS